MKNLLSVLSMVTLMFPAIAFSTPYSIDTAINAGVNSAGMNGMIVTVNLVGGAQDIKVWGTGIGGSGVSGTGWSLDFLGSNTSTLALDWKLVTSAPIESFTINTIPGNVFFDIIYDANNPLVNTVDSDRGFWGPNFEVSNTAFATSGTFGPNVIYTEAYQGSYGAEFFWEFSNPGYLSTASSFPDPSIGAHDLFSKLLIDFTASEGFTGTFYFGVDTDLVDGVNPVPEPATMLLFGLGLLGMSVVSRKRR